ncbi:MAG: mevalonate kinase [Chloroflexi bacterium]|nr:mevalonate kinase [Chloroflexota bacterium]
MPHASAPGKIILFGEHAVVYGRPALAVPVTQVHADVIIADSPRAETWIHAPDISLHAELSSLPSNHPIAAVIHNFFFAFGVSPFPSLDISIASTIPVASGLGSGAAVTVALLRALSSAVHRPLSDEQINQFAYEIEKLHHGTPSGIDNTVITYARPVYFIRPLPSPLGGGAGGGVETFTVGSPFTLVIADTGISAPTKESVGDVRKLWESDKPRWERAFDEIGGVVQNAKERIENGDWRLLGALMDSNHALLQSLTVSSPELDRLVESAREAGALGAKLSGGGRGGNMIALVEKDDAAQVAEALLSAGAKRTIVTEIA